MIAFSYFSLFAALTAVYLLFLFRMRAGMRALSGSGAQQSAAASDRGAQLTGGGGTSSPLPRVTVLVAMRNERDVIAECIRSLQAQDYPQDRMRVLLLDDHSEDGTREKACDAAGADTRFRIVALGAETAGKKAAITAGIREADGDCVATTDADCRHDPSWLRTLVAPLTDEADFCAGPVVYERRGSLFARLQALEFLGLVGIGAGFFGIGWPRLCNGANIAYRRAMFDAAGGYEGNAGVHSGDDEFLLHKIVYRLGGRAVFVAHPAAVVRTDGEPGVTGFLRQRIRWASKTRRYEDGRFVAFLVLLFVYFVFAAALPAIALTSPFALGAAFLFFLLKLGGEGAVLITAARLFQRPLRPLDLLVGEILHPYYIVTVSLVGMFGRVTWKNRRLQNR